MSSRTLAVCSRYSSSDFFSVSLALLLSFSYCRRSFWCHSVPTLAASASSFAWSGGGSCALSSNMSPSSSSSSFKERELGARGLGARGLGEDSVRERLTAGFPGPVETAPLGWTACWIACRRLSRAALRATRFSISVSKVVMRCAHSAMASEFRAAVPFKRSASMCWRRASRPKISASTQRFHLQLVRG